MADYAALRTLFNSLTGTDDQRIVLINIPNVPIGPYLTRHEIQNNSGTAWPATGTTISGQRKSIQNW